MNNLTLGQRLMADTPAFFKKAHVFGLMLIGLAITLAQYPVIPAKVTLILGVVGGSVAVLSLFAVKDVADLASGNIAAIVPDLLSQVQQVSNVLSDHSATLGSINSTLQTLATDPPDAPAPVINAPVIVTDASPLITGAIKAVEKIVIPPAPQV